MIAAYIRVSTDKQNLANQKEEIQRFAREQGMEIDVWVKETISGKTPSGKRKLGWLMRKVRKGDTLIVSEISRLSRSLTEIMEIMGKCLEKNIRLYTVKERYSFDDSINSKVGEVAAMVGQTPQSWNSSIFSMVRSLSDNVMIPIAGVILTLVSCMELIQMLIDRNNMHDTDVALIFRWVMKTSIATMLVTNTWNIVMGIFDVAQ